ncbi:NUDIX hydrolase [Allocoleopsis franciscana]|uniref:Isopentenyldiphosphate isomerase n=1 Tax=Allocoleopsis franciscana PCC 7113 TaxID=1173027 RepID=K9WFF6_9CYAN|nr:NUDIX domain-containing protein [Allocoleopsis franciscana]AFZ18504.1 isopentenyldiphosphate isomerase [Allocoleopsis franciscana PCC 7113]
MNQIILRAAIDNGVTMISEKMLQFQPDAEEVFDILDPVTGYPTGQTKARSLVHAEGDWHGAFHLWLVSHSKEPMMYLQRRKEDKDVAPGYLDVPVGGHYRSGEKMADGVREVEEEIGLTVKLEDLTPLGKRLVVYREQGVKNNELIDVFLYETDLTIEAFKLQPEELAGFYEIPVREMLKLFTLEGYSYEAQGVELLNRLPQAHQMNVTKKSFVPSIDAYPYKVAIQVERYFEGKQYLSI